MSCIEVVFVFQRRFWLGLVLLAAVLVLPGCAPHIEVLQSPVATPWPVATVAPERHALAVRGVDFEPPLDVFQMTMSGGVTLLAAVQNRGLSAERDVRVTARLVDPGNLQELLNETVTLPILTPGEVRIARFTQVSDLPRRPSYRLLVHVEPVQGETDTADNAVSYDIVVHVQE
jgi:hypothetical protein